VRQRQKDDLMSGQRFKRRLSHHPVGQGCQLGLLLAKPSSRAGPRRDGTDPHLRMAEQQAKQLSARIASGANHCNSKRHGT
jgi:hypothetical protein